MKKLGDIFRTRGASNLVRKEQYNNEFSISDDYNFNLWGVSIKFGGAQA